MFLNASSGLADIIFQNKEISEQTVQILFFFVDKSNYNNHH